MNPWLEARAGVLAALVLAAALAAYVHGASASWLNPDEALHYFIASATGLVDLWRAIRERDTHPPLFIGVLHLVLKVGHSEFLLRLPAIAATSLAGWCIFCFWRRLFGAPAALAGLAVFVFSPGVVSAATEARSYGFLLFFLCAALAAFERGVAERDARFVLLHGISLCGAMLSHFATFVVVPVFAVSALARLRLGRASSTLWRAWIAGEALLTAVAATLYVLQARPLAMHYATGAWIDVDRYVPGRDTILDFVTTHAGAFVGYAIGGQLAPTAAVVLGILGMLAAAARRPSARTRVERQVLALAVLMVGAGCLAAVLHLLPFGGTRHSIYLWPFAATALTAGLAVIVRGRMSVGLALAALMGVVLVRHPADNVVCRPKMTMVSALEFLRREVPAGRPLIVDQETQLDLAYYLEPDSARPHDTSDRITTTVDGRAVEVFRDTVTTEGQTRTLFGTPNVWSFDDHDFRRQVRDLLVATGHAGDHDPLWALSVGWAARPIAPELPPSALLAEQRFGPIVFLQLAPAAFE